MNPRSIRRAMAAAMLGCFAAGSALADRGDCRNDGAPPISFVQFSSPNLASPDRC